MCLTPLLNDAKHFKFSEINDASGRAKSKSFQNFTLESPRDMENSTIYSLVVPTDKLSSHNSSCLNLIIMKKPQLQQSWGNRHVPKIQLAAKTNK